MVSDLFSLFPFFIFLLGLHSLISGITSLVYLNRKVEKRKDKLLVKLRKKGKDGVVSLEKLKNNERLSALFSVVIGLLFCIFILARLNIAILDPGVLVLEIGDESATVANEYETIISDFVNSKNMPGLVVGIVQGEDSFLYTYGYESLDQTRRVNQTTIFEIGSISKAFTGLMFTDSMNRGLITLGDL